MRAGVALLLCLALGACASVPPPILDDAVDAGPGGDPERQILVTFRDGEALPFARAGATPKSYRDAPVYGSRSASSRLARVLARDHDLRTVVEWPIDVLGVHCVVYEIGAGARRSDLLRALQSDPRIALAEPMQVFSTRAASYDDPYVPLQSGYLQMNLRSAHSAATGRGVRIAVIDTGLDARHPDIASRIELSEDLVPGGSASTGASRRGTGERHGLAVAGVMAATANNGVGIVGVAPEAQLVALRACWQPQPGGMDAGAVCNSFTLALALARAVELRVAVINLSLGGPRDRLLAQLLERALAAGIVVVGALPVHAHPEDQFPTSTRGVIAVRTGELPDIDAPALPAPGVDILTLTPDEHYDFASGSSLAAAHVSGLVALLLERSPRLSHERIRAILDDSVAPVTLVRGVAGARTVDACRALAALGDELDCVVGSEASRPVVAASPGPANPRRTR